MSDHAVSLTIHLEDPSPGIMFDLVRELTKVGLNLHAKTLSTVSLFINATDEEETEKSDKDSFDEVVSMLVAWGIGPAMARTLAENMRDSRVLRET